MKSCWVISFSFVLSILCLKKQLSSFYFRIEQNFFLCLLPYVFIWKIICFIDNNFSCFFHYYFMFSIKHVMESIQFFFVEKNNDDSLIDYAINMIT